MIAAIMQQTNDFSFYNLFIIRHSHAKCQRSSIFIDKKYILRRFEKKKNLLRKENIQ